MHSIGPPRASFGVFYLSMSGIYLHIPFCRRACSYCDFYFSTTRTLLEAFVVAIQREIRQAPDGWRSETIETIYFGGGTPSMLSNEDLTAILAVLRTVFSIAPNAEITLEANPEDISPAQCEHWLQAGINRLSLGVQTFDAAALRWMNRPHTPSDAVQAIRTVSNAGFSSFSCDLIYAQPGQTEEGLLTDLHTLLAFQPPHLSAYTLTIEEGTRLHGQIRKGKLTPADDDTAALHMERTSSELRKHGYMRYEVSNFCLAGHHSRHNSAYWNHIPYYGFGPGAHSFQTLDAGKTGLRWSNPPALNRYVKQEDFSLFRVEEPVGSLALLEEKIYLKLRTASGLDLKELYAETAVSTPPSLHQKINRFVAEGLLVQDGTRIAVTEKGFPVSDGIALEILAIFSA